MKKLALSLLAAGVIAAPSLASAAEPYVSFSAGMGFMHNTDIKADGEKFNDALEYKTGYALEGALGMQMEMFRVELAGGYQSNKIDTFFDLDLDEAEEESGVDFDTDVSVISVMANGYADLDMSDQIAPYVMAGAGMAFAEMSLDVEGEEPMSESDSAFAWQVGAGIGVQASEQIAVDLGYRYFATADLTLDDTKAKLDSSKLMLGMRYSF